MEVDVKILILATLLFFNATLFAQTAYSNPNHSAAVLATASFGALTRPRLPVPPQWSAPELTQMWAIASELPWTVAENEQPAGTKSFSFPPQPRGVRRWMGRRSFARIAKMGPPAGWPVLWKNSGCRS